MKAFSIVNTTVLGTLLLWPSPSNAQPWQAVDPQTHTIRVVPVAELPTVELPADAEPKLAEDLQKARVNGKYRTLLQQIERPADANEFGPFRDYGLFQGTEWKGIENPPQGFWVYVQPYWYVWRDLAAQPRPLRGWGADQLTGAPNTERAGDVSTSWASRTQDDQAEWLLLEYDEPIAATGIKIYETFNPGAVNRVTAFTLDGKEIEIWQGTDPTHDVQNIGVLSLQFKASFKTNRVKVYIDSPRVKGWNEIDAVGLVDEAGKMRWATNAAASSTYAEQDKPFIFTPRRLQPLDEDLTVQRINQLEAELATLKSEVARLQQMLKNQVGQPEQNK